MHLARALAAETASLVADEPVAALDPRYQHEIARLFASTAHAGRGVLTVMPDLPLAARYADRLIWMKDGRIVADGSVRETLTPERLGDVFGIEAEVSSEGSHVVLNVDGPSLRPPEGRTP